MKKKKRVPLVLITFFILGLALIFLSNILKWHHYSLVRAFGFVISALCVVVFIVARAGAQSAYNISKTNENE